MGAAAYQMFGWGSDNYLSDLNQRPSRWAAPLRRDFHQGPIVFTEEGTAQMEVRLVDDNGDGVPDRGVIDLPPSKGAFGRSFGPPPSRYFNDGFGPGRASFGRGIGPFFLVGGLFRLAFLVLLVGLGVYFYRRWQANRSAAPADPKPER